MPLLPQQLTLTAWCRVYGGVEAAVYSSERIFCRRFLASLCCFFFAKQSVFSVCLNKSFFSSATQLPHFCFS